MCTLARLSRASHRTPRRATSCAHARDERVSTFSTHACVVISIMFSSTASRLASCPVCGKSVHIALVAAHVDHCLNATQANATTSVKASIEATRGHGYDSGASARPNARRVSGDVEDTSRAAARRGETTTTTTTAAAHRGALFRDRERKRNRGVLLDTSNVGGTMKAFVKNIGGASAAERQSTTMVHAETQTDFAAPVNDRLNACDGGDGVDAGGTDDVDVDKAVEDVEGGAPSRIAFDLRMMSGNHEECGICLTAFDDDEGVHRYMFYPCQHVRQCGDCAQRVWQVPKAKRRCPWCKSKIEIRPRAFKPFM